MTEAEIKAETGRKRCPQFLSNYKSTMTASNFSKTILGLTEVFSEGLTYYSADKMLRNISIGLFGCMGHTAYAYNLVLELCEPCS